MVLLTLPKLFLWRVYMLNVASLIWVLLEEISLGERILNLEASIKKWLDYCLVSNDWRLCFPHVVVEVLKPHKFDHDLLFLSCCKFKSNKVHYFHFQATWISHPGYGPCERCSISDELTLVICNLDIFLYTLLSAQSLKVELWYQTVEANNTRMSVELCF